jgi:hypothetical protein
VQAFNEDGRDFIRASARRMKEWHDTRKEVQIPAKKWLSDEGSKRKVIAPPDIVPIPETISHFVMNLPATATEFLGNVFNRLSDFRCFSWRISRQSGTVPASYGCPITDGTRLLFSPACRGK